MIAELVRGLVHDGERLGGIGLALSITVDSITNRIAAVADRRPVSLASRRLGAKPI